MRRPAIVLALCAALAGAAPARAQAPPAPSLKVDTFFAPQTGGIADGDFSPTNIVADIPAAVAVHGDRIYTVGRTGSSSSADIGIIARRTDGTLETGFSGDGLLQIPVAPTSASPPVPAGNEEDIGLGIVALPSGLLRVIGTTDTILGAAINRDVIVLGLNADGTPDTTFGSPDVRGNQRVILFPGNAGDDVPTRIAAGPDNRVAIVGATKVAARDDLFVALLDEHGSPVTAFGPGGYRILNQGGGAVNDRGVDVVFRAGGGLAVLGGVDGPVKAVLHAFETDGDPDPAFGVAGDVALDVGGTSTVSGGLIEHAGTLYASGSTTIGSDTDAFVARVDAAGTAVEPRRFDMRGRFVPAANAATSHAADLAVAPGPPPTLVAVGAVQYTTELGSSATDWAAAAFNNFEGGLAQAGYGDLVIPVPGDGGIASVATGGAGWLAVAGRHVFNSDEGFGGARLLLDADKECDLAVAVAEPAEIVFRGLQPAALGARVTNQGTRPCAGTITVPAPYRMAPVETGPVAPGDTFVAAAVPISFDGARRAEDVLPVTLAAADDSDLTNNLTAAHVVFSFCDLGLEPVGRAGAVPSEGKRRFPVTLRNSGTIPCRVRIGSRPRYSLAGGQSVADRVPAGAPRGAAPGARVAVVLRAAATDDVNPVNDAATVRPVVVGVGDSDVRSHGARRFAGTARKGTGPLAPARLRPARVDVALLRKDAGGCGWLRSDRGAFKPGRPRAGGGCSGRRWVRARGTARWHVRLSRALRPGRYVLLSRATIRVGFHEARFSSADRNRIEFRIR